MVLDNKLCTYCTVNLAEAAKQAVDARERPWSRCTWQVRLMTADFGAWELAKARGFAKQKITMR